MNINGRYNVLQWWWKLRKIRQYSAVKRMRVFASVISRYLGGETSAAYLFPKVVSVTHLLRGKLHVYKWRTSTCINAKPRIISFVKYKVLHGHKWCAMFGCQARFDISLIWELVGPDFVSSICFIHFMHLTALSLLPSPPFYSLLSALLSFCSILYSM